MFFNTFIFYIFLAGVLGIFLVLRGPRARAAWLLAASYVFYAYCDWRFTALLGATTAVDFAIGRTLERTTGSAARKRLLLLSCAWNLGVLGFFKYFNFFVDSAQAVAETLGLRFDAVHVRVLLPLGISFFTLKSLSYTIDVYRRRLAPTRSRLDYALFVSFFPSLLAGPLDRAGSLLPQFERLGRPSRLQAGSGLVLISIGLLQKVLIGDAAGRVVDQLFGQPHLYHSPELLAGLLLYSIQIYADFAGYSNIARGVARLFGVELMRNFEQPYLSRSFSEFWRRWHISLSSWITDYIFNPIMSAALKRLERWNLATVQQEMAIAYPIAVLATMLLCGLWHGAGVTFIIWGGLHGLYLAGERLLVYRGRTIRRRPRLRGAREIGRFAIGLATTQLLVLLAWLFFRAEDLAQVGDLLGRIFLWEGSELTGRFATMVTAFGGMLLALDIADYLNRGESFMLRLRPAVAAGACLAVAVTVALYLATNKPLPFVYFRF